MNISLALFSNIISDQVKQVQQQKSKQLNWRQEKEKLIKVFNDNKQRSSTQERPQERKSRNLMEFLYNRQSGEKTTRETKRNLSPSPNKISLSTIITKYQKQVEHQKESIQPISTNDFADKIIESFNQLKNQQRQKFNQKCYSEQKEDSGHKDHIMSRINSIKEMLDQVIPNKDLKQSQSTEKQNQVKTGGTDKKLSIQNFNIYQNEAKPSAPTSQVSSNIWKDRIQCIESQYQSEDESYASRNKSVEIRQWIDQHLSSQSNHQSIITQKFNKLRNIKSCTTLDVGIQVEMNNPCIKINLPKLELSGIKFSSQKYEDADDVKSNPDSNLFSQKQELLQIQIPDPSEELQIQPLSQTTRSIQIPQLIQQPIIYQQEFQANLAEAFSNRLTERLEKLQESDQIDEMQESDHKSMEKSQSSIADQEITEKELIENKSTNGKDETDPNEPILFKQFLQTQQLQLQDLNLRQFTDVQLQYSEDTANQRFQTNNSVQEEKVDQSQEAQTYQVCEVKHESLNQSSFEQWLLSKSNVDARQIINLNCQSQYLKKDKQQSNQVDHSTQINKQDIDDSDSDEEIAEIKQKHKVNQHQQGVTLLIRKILQLNKMILIKSFYVIKDAKKKKSTAMETINTILNTIAEETGYDTLRTLQRNNSALQDIDSLNKPHLDRIRNSSYFQKLSSSKKKGMTSPVQQINDRIKVNFVQEMGLESPVQKSTEQVEFNDFSPIADPMEYQEVSIFKEPKKSNKSSTHKKPNNSESQILTNHIAIQKARIGKKFQQIHYRTAGQKQSKENIFAK